MPDFAAFLNATRLRALPANSVRSRAALAWRHIEDKPTVVAFSTPTRVKLAAQTVRIEHDDNARLALSAAGAAPVRAVIIFGVRGHATVPDTIVDEGYTFVLAGDLYRVVDTTTTDIGEIRAIAEVTG